MWVHKPPNPYICPPMHNSCVASLHAVLQCLGWHKHWLSIHVQCTTVNYYAIASEYTDLSVFIQEFDYKYTSNFENTEKLGRLNTYTTCGGHCKIQKLHAKYRKNGCIVLKCEQTGWRHCYAQACSNNLMS